MIVDTPQTPEIADDNSWEEVNPGRPDEEALGYLTNELSSGLYSNPIRSLVRETVSNAVDSHAERYGRDENGRVQGPKIKVSVKTGTVFSEEGSVFIVEDQGVGLSHENVLKHFAAYGTSTKRNNNNELGAKGVGAKSPFAYRDNLVVESFYEGAHNLYYWEKSFPQNRLRMPFRNRDTDRTNGVIIRVPIEPGDEERFKRAVQNELAYYQYALELEGVTCEYVPRQHQDTPFYFINSIEDNRGCKKWVANKTGNEPPENLQQFHVVMDGAIYSVPGKQILRQTEEYLSKEEMAEIDATYGTSLHSGHNLENTYISTVSIARGIGAKVDIGDLDVTTSREELRMTDKTRKRILIAVLELGHEIWRIVQRLYEGRKLPNGQSIMEATPEDITTEETAKAVLTHSSSLHLISQIGRSYNSKGFWASEEKAADMLPESWGNIISEEFESPHDLAFVTSVFKHKWAARVNPLLPDAEDKKQAESTYADMKKKLNDSFSISQDALSRVQPNYSSSTDSLFTLSTTPKALDSEKIEDLLKQSKLFYTTNVNASRARAKKGYHLYGPAYYIVHVERVSPLIGKAIQMLAKDHKAIETDGENRRKSDLDDTVIPIRVIDEESSTQRRIKLDYLADPDRTVHVIYGHQEHRNQLEQIAKVLNRLNLLEIRTEPNQAKAYAEHHRKNGLNELQAAYRYADKPSTQDYLAAARTTDLFAPGHTYIVGLIAKSNAAPMQSGSFTREDVAIEMETQRSYDSPDSNSIHDVRSRVTSKHMQSCAVPSGDFFVEELAADIWPEDVRQDGSWPADLKEEGTISDYFAWIEARLYYTTELAKNTPELGYGYMGALLTKLYSISKAQSMRPQTKIEDRMSLNGFISPDHPAVRSASYNRDAWFEGCRSTDVCPLGLTNAELSLVADYVEQTYYYNQFTTYNWYPLVWNGAPQQAMQLPKVRYDRARETLVQSLIETTERFDHKYGQLSSKDRTLPLGIPHGLSGDVPVFGESEDVHMPE